jgi:uncharacterized protein (TIGR02246 family)
MMASSRAPQREYARLCPCLAFLVKSDGPGQRRQSAMSQSDEDAIREIENRFNAAWNAHDPDAIAESLTDDAQFITVNGAWTTSREGFRDLMRRLHGSTGPFRSSKRRTPEIQVRFLTPDIAMVHSRFWISGEVMHDELSQADRESVGIRVVRKIHGRWRIVATQNTDVRHGRRH